MWPFPRTDRFAQPGTIRDIYNRFGAFQQQVDREQFEFCLQTGRGMIELELTPEQYAVLKEENEGSM